MGNLESYKMATSKNSLNIHVENIVSGTWQMKAFFSEVQWALASFTSTPSNLSSRQRWVEALPSGGLSQ